MTSATETLESDLQDLGKPDTQAGPQAKDLLDQLSSDLKTNTDSIKTAVDGVSDSSDVLGAVGTVSTALATMQNRSPRPTRTSNSLTPRASCRPQSSSRAPASSSPVASGIRSAPGQTKPERLRKGGGLGRPFGSVTGLPSLVAL
jgi:hypothetical protein